MSNAIGDYDGMLKKLGVRKAKVYPVLEDKVAIITGAATGMGKATALIFAEAGASVVLGDLNLSGAEAVAAEIGHAGGQAYAVHVDISDSASVQNLVAKAVEKYGKLDCAVNNAAMTPDGLPIVSFDEEYFDKLAAVNIKGTTICNKYEIAAMRKQGHGGSIVNISSIVAYHAHANMVAYTMSKHAIVGLTKQAASENADMNIRVNTICPGAVLTEMSAKALLTMGTDHEEYARQTNMLGRWANPHEIAQGSLWLCSDAASFVTATCLPIDAGSHTK